MEKGKVDLELIRRYVRGELTPREMYALERQAQDEPMLMDIILGMEQEAPQVHGDNLADIRKRIAERSRRPRAASRRLMPAQRWAIAASILAVLTVGMWWFIRDDTQAQREATVAATPQEVPQQAAPETAPSPEQAFPTEERTADTAPQPARTAPPVSAATSAERVEKKAARLAVTTPKSDNDTAPVDSIVVVSFGTQAKSAIIGSVARTAAAEVNTPVRVNEQAFAGRTDGIRIRGTSIQQHVPRPRVSGKVVDQETQEPLAGVTLQTTDGQRVATDALGRFTLPDTSRTLISQYIGYEQQTLDITGLDTLTIALKPTDVGLDEVVVVGYGTGKRQTPTVNARRPEISEPQPKDGWDAYRQYLKDAMKLADDRGSIELDFKIDDEGRPTAVTVIETTNEKLNAFATIIVRDGPRWLPGENDERKVTLRITF